MIAGWSTVLDDQAGGVLVDNRWQYRMLAVQRFNCWQKLRDASAANAGV